MSRWLLIFALSIGALLFVIAGCRKPETLPLPDSIAKLLPHPKCATGERYDYEWRDYNSITFLCEVGEWYISGIYIRKPSMAEAQAVLTIEGIIKPGTPGEWSCCSAVTK